MLTRRACGILLHVTSLPSVFGIGDTGPSATAFLEFLVQSGQSFWQILPLHPTDSVFGHSPYSVSTAFAGNPMLVSPELLVRDGFLDPDALVGAPDSSDRVLYDVVVPWKSNILRMAAGRFAGSSEYDRFVSEQNAWLEPHSLFVALKRRFSGRPWTRWPADLRDRDPKALARAAEDLEPEIAREKFHQFVFHKQWLELRRQYNGRGIRIIGDVPIYVNHDSVDAWSHRELFDLDPQGMPRSVSGVPPDRFSSTGQLWGTALYRWDRMRQDGYAWWIRRLRRQLELFDWVRLDHFRGFAGYWAVPLGASTAQGGEWRKGPGSEFLREVRRQIPDLPIIAEDLGTITPDVIELMNEFDLPGMRPLLSAFSKNFPRDVAAPHHHVPNCVVYTGTHDNNTVRGWYEKETTEAEREVLEAYLGREVSAEHVHLDFIRMAMGSVARLAILPMQDVLGLGAEARMNRPAHGSGNWEWRLGPGQLTPALIDRLRWRAWITGRIVQPRATS